MDDGGKGGVNLSMVNRVPIFAGGHFLSYRKVATFAFTHYGHSGFGEAKDRNLCLYY